MNGPSILVAEDEAFLHIGLEDALTEAGLNPVLTLNGTDAIKELEKVGSASSRR